VAVQLTQKTLVTNIFGSNLDIIEKWLKWQFTLATVCRQISNAVMTK